MTAESDSQAESAGRLAGLIFWIAVAFSTFQLVTAAFSPLSSSVVRAVHVGFLLLMTFALYPSFRAGNHAPGTSIKALAWLLGSLAFLLSFYHWLFESALIQRSGALNTVDIVVGSVMVLLVFEGARRIMGPALPLICLGFLLYALFGEYFPGPLAHRGFAFEQVVEQLGFGTEGIYGTPTYVSSSYIFLFILFGSFLEEAGMIRLFTDFALGTVGHTKGGPAKVAVIASGLMGTINGSGVANVVTTGQFTIPLMKKFGYRASFAGGVEATASMGGQIMPPVMGAVAFIMAETINVPYVEICKAALVPALLYFVTAFWMVHLEAGRANLVGLPKEECPNAWQAVTRQWYLLLPLIGLVYLLFTGYTPLFSGMVGLALTVVLIFGTTIAGNIGAFGLKVAFWIMLGVACSAFFKLGIGAVLAVIAVLVVTNLKIRGGRESVKLAVNAMAEGASHALPVGMACALVGVIIGTLTLTGAATTFAGFVVSIGHQSLFLSLFLTMLTCLVLGMGIPTIPNYIITSAIAAPALLDLGVPLIVSHMFVFYFGIMADLTPPVALAAFAASPIAKAPAMQIGLQAMRIAIAGFVVPYMAVYAPVLMLQGGSILDFVYILFKALIAIGLWGAASIGYLVGPLRWPQRLLALCAAFLLVVAIPVTDEAGFALALVFVVWHWRSRSGNTVAA